MRIFSHYSLQFFRPPFGHFAIRQFLFAENRLFPNIFSLKTLLLLYFIITIIISPNFTTLPSSFIIKLVKDG